MEKVKGVRTQRRKFQIEKLRTALINGRVERESSDYNRGLRDALDWILGEDVEDLNALAGLTMPTDEKGSNPHEGPPRA